MVSLKVRLSSAEGNRQTLLLVLLPMLMAGWGCRASGEGSPLSRDAATTQDGAPAEAPEGTAPIDAAVADGGARGRDHVADAGVVDPATQSDGPPLDAGGTVDLAHDGQVGDGASSSSDGRTTADADGNISCPSGMVRIPARGQSFMMGFTTAEAGTEWACFIGQHKVTFTYDFCMDATLVQQKDYLKLMGNNPSAHKTSDMTMPVDAVTWYDAVLYCNERSRQEGLEPAYSYASLTRAGNHVTAMANFNYDITKNGYRLPTNAEYEFAERANLTDYLYIYSKTATSDINTATGPADAYSWNQYNAGNTSHPVGTKKPNPWGLYDIVGNLFEWENDWEGPYLTTDQIDPTGPANGDTPCGTDNTQTPKRMGKGGSYAQDPKNHGRISYHYKFFPTTINSQMGLRCVATAR